MFRIYKIFFIIHTRTHFYSIGGSNSDNETRIVNFTNLEITHPTADAKLSRCKKSLFALCVLKSRY